MPVHQKVECASQPSWAAAFAIAVVLAFTLRSRADLDDGPPAQIAATVTAKMGDIGGKFFGRIPDAARTHHYYIAAESELWDYAPRGRDVVCGKPFPPSLAKEHKNMKTRYVQYTDETFQTRVRKNPGLGIMGPVLRGQMGEFLAVTFLNRTLSPLSMHPHGVRYDKDSEGSYYQPAPGNGAAVGQGARFTYVWQLDESSGPLPGEPSSKAWLYHSHVAGDEEIQQGLIGCIVVTDPHRSRPDGSPNDVDREFVSLYMVFDESGIDPFNPLTDWAKGRELIEQGSRYTINGLTFGNLPDLEINQGERVRWYLLGLGSEQDLHTAHWHGLRVVEDGRRRTDVVELLPATTKVADMVTDNPGSWLMHCHVSEHMREGMFARVTVHPRNSPRAPQSAFPGLGAAVQSLQITRAEVLPASDHHELRLQGTLTVLPAFSVAESSIALRIGEKTFACKLDGMGAADQTGISFHVRNAGRSGTVRGGLLEFECVLSAGDWRHEVEKIAATLSAASHAEPLLVSVSLTIDSIQHSGMAEITSVGKDR